MNFELGNTPKDDHVQKPIYKSTSKGWYYCIFRVGKSYKTLGQITGFEKHMERLQDTPNADPNIPNEILIGGQNLSERVKDYIKDCQYSTNGKTTIARELMITASPDFFKGMSENELRLWVNQNIKYLNEKYGDKVLYCTFHRDERTPHLHILLSPRVYSEKRKCYVLSNNQLFGNKIKLRELQTDYAAHIGKTFPNLNRGIMNSKAKHIEIRHFYGIINNVKSRENADIILKNDILIQAKLKGLNGTLEAYRKLLDDKESTLEDLAKQLHEIKTAVKEIKKDRDIYKSVVKQLSQQYKLPQNAIEKALKHAQEVERER